MADERKLHGNEKAKPKQKQINCIRVNGTEWHIDSRYEPTAILGQGAYGVVCLAKDSKSRTNVAIKRCMLAEKHYEAFARRTLREICILRHSKHPNVVSLYDVMPPLQRDQFDCVYLVMEALSQPLNKVLRAKPLRVEAIDIQIIVYQILNGLRYLHQAGIVHRDLKPSNILLDGKLGVKICDFGLARAVRASQEGREGDGSLTEYVISRHYRAPEVMTNPSHYDRKVDVWAVGCILAEFFLGRVLFKGRDCLKQLQLILQVTGTPTEEELAALHPNVAGFIRKLGPIPKADLSKLFPNADDQARDLLASMLLFSPEKRISIDQALQHPWFKLMLSDPYWLANFSDDIKKASIAPTRFDLDWDRPEISKEEIVDRLCQEVVLFRPEMRATLLSVDVLSPAPLFSPREDVLSPDEWALPSPEKSERLPTEPSKAVPIGGSNKEQKEQGVKVEVKEQMNKSEKLVPSPKEPSRVPQPPGGVKIQVEVKEHMSRSEKSESLGSEESADVHLEKLSLTISSRDDLLRGGSGVKQISVVPAIFIPLPLLNCMSRPDK